LLKQVMQPVKVMKSTLVFS